MIMIIQNVYIIYDIICKTYIWFKVRQLLISSSFVIEYCKTETM